MTTLEKDILQVLTDDARISAKKIAAMLSTDEEMVKAAIRDMEQKGVIVKYTAIVNDEKADDTLVSALIEVKVTPKKKEGFDGIAQQIAAFPEVKSVYLMSGAYDLLVIVEGSNIKQLAIFVGEKLSTIEHVLSTATHFVLKKYKQDGVIMEKETEDDRLQVSP